MESKDKNNSVNGCKIEDLIEKHKETLDRFHFNNETEKSIFALVLELNELPNSTLLRVEHTLNTDGWPEELSAKPDGWDDMDIKQQDVWARPLLAYLETVISKKDSLRYHSTENLKRSNAEFEEWWIAHTLETFVEEKGYFKRYVPEEVTAVEKEVYEKSLRKHKFRKVRRFLICILLAIVSGLVIAYLSTLI